MNKKIMRVAILSIALMGALFLLNSNDTNAQTAPILTLTVSGGNQTCRVGTAMNLGSITASATTGYLSGAFSGSDGTNTWKCTDLSGSTARNLTVVSANLQNAASNTISSGNVKLWANIETRNQGDCLTGGAGFSNTGLNSTKTILQTTGGPYSICEVQTTGVMIGVDVPPYQPRGVYTGTITIILPGAGFSAL